MMEKDLYIFDLDNTLASRGSYELYKHVALWLEQNRPQRVAIATNQGGVGMRYWMESGDFGDPEKYPRREDVARQIHRIAGQVAAITGGRVLTFAAFRYQSRKGNWSPVPSGQERNPEWSKQWRKPGPGLGLAAAREFGVDPADCVFVGDALGHNEETSPDRLAAEAAGMSFVFEDKFFGRAVTVTYRPEAMIEWMKPHDRIGLDPEATAARFEEVVGDNITSYAHVTGVSFRRRDEMEDGDLVFDKYAGVMIDERSVVRQINAFILRGEHLVYETAEDHAEAMATHTAVYPGLRVQLRNVYGVSQETADALIAAARGERQQ